MKIATRLLLGSAEKQRSDEVRPFTAGEEGVHDEPKQVAGNNWIEEARAPRARPVEQEANRSDPDYARDRACCVADPKKGTSILWRQVLHSCSNFTSAHSGDRSRLIAVLETCLVIAVEATSRPGTKRE